MNGAKNIGRFLARSLSCFASLMVAKTRVSHHAAPHGQSAWERSVGGGG